jgi:hypothetical protein
MSNQIPSVPGLKLPTQIGMISGNPRDSAIASQNQVNQKQTNLGNAVGGKKNKKKGGTSSSSNNSIIVPQFTMPYQPTGGPGQDPNSIIQQNSQTSTQASANAVYDNYATQKGGKTKKRRGGSSKYNWGCYSGGNRKHKHNRIKKTKKGKKVKR